MTSIFTNNFDKRGAVSVRIILEDAPLSGEYRYDGQHGKYYFGARYFDPFFGLWMSPDPASVFFREVYTPLKWRNFIKKDILRRSGFEAAFLLRSNRDSAQFANPYSYGGDPINYIDPTGLWAVGLGFVVGWDNKSEWSFGVGAAADFEVIGADFSYRFNQDGSKSLNLGVKADIPIPTPWVYFEINMGLGFSMNSYSGATLSTHGGLCVGEVGLCGGVETGGSLYWDRGGSFMGVTVYAEAYASLGYGMDRVSTGYEAGFFGMEGRGLYAGGNLNVGVSLYASWAENGGWNYGGGYKFNIARYESDGYYSKLNLLGGLYSSESLLLSADYAYTGDANVAIWAEYLIDLDPSLYTLMAHGNTDGIFLNPSESGFLDGVDLADKLKNDKKWNYKEGQTIKLYSCSTGGSSARGELNVAQVLANAMGVTVIAPTKDVLAKTNSFPWFKWTSTTVQDGGKFEKFRPEK